MIAAVITHKITHAVRAAIDRCEMIARRETVVVITCERVIETDVTVSNGNTIIFIASPFRRQSSCVELAFEGKLVLVKKNPSQGRETRDGVIGAANVVRAFRTCEYKIAAHNKIVN